MLKIRLRRMGAKHDPFFRIVVSENTKTPTSSFVDTVGYYDPKEHPSKIEVDFEKVDKWIKVGAKPSETVTNLLKKAKIQAGR